MSRLLVLLLLLSCTTALHAQGTIVDAPATFVRGASPFDASPDANFTGVSNPATQDHLFETGWWFRIAGDTQETFFPVPTTQAYVGNISTLDWTNVGGRGLFSAREVSNVGNGGLPSGIVEMVMTITNIGMSDLQIDMFHMVDIDIQLTAGNDTAAIQASDISKWMLLRDAGVNTAQYVGEGASAYLVRPFGATDVATVLSNTVVDNFDNSGLPFGPGDFTAGMQWSAVNIPVAQSRSFRVYLLVNVPFPNLLFAHGFEDPAPDAAPDSD